MEDETLGIIGALEDGGCDVGEKVEREGAEVSDNVPPARKVMYKCSCNHMTFIPLLILPRSSILYPESMQSTHLYIYTLHLLLLESSQQL